MSHKSRPSSGAYGDDQSGWRRRRVDHGNVWRKNQRTSFRHCHRALLPDRRRSARGDRKRVSICRPARQIEHRSCPPHPPPCASAVDMSSNSRALMRPTGSLPDRGARWIEHRLCGDWCDSSRLYESRRPGRIARISDYGRDPDGAPAFSAGRAGWFARAIGEWKHSDEVGRSIGYESGVAGFPTGSATGFLTFRATSGSMQSFQGAIILSETSGSLEREHVRCYGFDSCAVHWRGCCVRKSRCSHQRRVH